VLGGFANAAAPEGTWTWPLILISVGGVWDATCGGAAIAGCACAAALEYTMASTTATAAKERFMSKLLSLRETDLDSVLKERLVPRTSRPILRDGSNISETSGPM
jgi:hypothetical protein